MQRAVAPEHVPPAHILVIDDNPGDVQLLRLALAEQDRPFTLQVLRDGAEALDFVEQQRVSRENTPCVIVLDLHLPKHEGLAVLSKIRRTVELAHVHVVVLTSSATPHEVNEARELGVVWYREKPTDVDEFLEVARRIFEACDQRTIVDAA